MGIKRRLVTAKVILCLATLTCANVTLAVSQNIPPKIRPVDPFNYILGTQTIGVKYQFTEATKLVETATRVLDMGSNLLKFSMNKRYCGRDYALPKREDIQSLAHLASQEPSFREVLNMPFAFYHIWAYCFSSTRWADGLSNEERRAEYNELYALALHLLKTYSQTGKTFFIGHWEGDWHLRPRPCDSARHGTQRLHQAATSGSGDAPDEPPAP
jgi:hypothetical protein